MGVITANCGETRKIGYQTENNRTQVRFPLADIITEFPGGTATLVIQRAGDEAAAPAAEYAMDGTDLIWTVTAWECAVPGFLYAQVIYAVTAGEVVAKSKIYRFTVKESLLNGAVEPDDWEDWVGELTLAAAGVNDAISAAQETLDAKVAAAQAAQTAAETAQGKSETAQTGAETAQGKAEAAQTAAETAQGKAEDAERGALAAKGAAETAQGAAERAQSAAETAVTHYPRITNGKWEVWDVNQDKYVDTGVTAVGQDGRGLPAGGTTGQVPKKKSATDFDIEWGDEEGGDPTSIIDDNAGAGDTDKTFSADKLTGEFSSVLSALNQSNAATNSDIGKAHSPKTVDENGHVTEWQYVPVGGGGGSVDPEDIAEAVSNWCEENITEDPTVVIDKSLLVDGAAADAAKVGEEITQLKYFTENPSVNLADDSEWTTAGTAPLIPVEYGKTYSSNFTAYGFSVYCYDANKNSLGANNAYNGVTITDDGYYDGSNKKYKFVIAKEAVSYVQVRIAKPDIGPMFLEGDVAIPVIYIPFSQKVVSPNEPGLGKLKSVMLGSHPVELNDIENGLKKKLLGFGYESRLLSYDELYDYDPENSNIDISNGAIKFNLNQSTGAIMETVYFEKNVYKVHYLFDGSGQGIAMRVVLQDNINRSGIFFDIGINKINYLYALYSDNTRRAASNAFAETFEENYDEIEIERLSTSYKFTWYKDGIDPLIRTFTFAQLNIVDDPGRMGLHFFNNTTTYRPYTVFTRHFFVSAKSIYDNAGSSTSVSRLNGKTWDAWGDSFTEGDGTYVSKVENDTGCSATNLGNSGDKVSQVLTRFNNRSDACGDYVTIFAGVNDFLHDTLLETFRTNVQDFISAVIQKAPGSKFGWIIPPQTGAQATNTLNLTLADYDDVIIEICRRNSVPILDLYHSGNWYGTVAEFNAIYIGGDGLHPSAAGQALLADKIQTFLESL